MGAEPVILHESHQNFFSQFSRYIEHFPFASTYNMPVQKSDVLTIPGEEEWRITPVTWKQSFKEFRKDYFCIEFTNTRGMYRPALGVNLHSSYIQQPTSLKRPTFCTSQRSCWTTSSRQRLRRPTRASSSRSIMITCMGSRRGTSTVFLCTMISRAPFSRYVHIEPINIAL